MIDILEQFGPYRGFFEVQRFIDTYGIVVENFQENKRNGLLSFPEYRIKFSIPESWESDAISDKSFQEKIRLASEFKSKVNDALVEIWRATDDGYDDDFYKECTESFKYQYRTRSGEIWTLEKRDAALAKTNAGIDMVSELLKQQSEYEEV